MNSSQSTPASAATADFWDTAYQKFDPTRAVTNNLELPPGAESLNGKNLLIVACGTGEHVVRACREGAQVTALDISSIAVQNAREMVAHNKLNAQFVVADAAHTGLDDQSFDLIWGSAVLHHLDHEQAAAEFARILKPGGSIYMLGEPTFFNPVLKFSYEFAFGKGRVGRRRKFLFFRRIGDDFEKPIEESDLNIWRKNFNVAATSRGLMFIEKLGHTLSRSARVHRAFEGVDRAALSAFPRLKKYGYEYDFILTKRIAA